MPAYNELEILHHLKYNMKLLAEENIKELFLSTEDKRVSDVENALENFIDAYLLYSQDNKTHLEQLEVKKGVILALRLLGSLTVKDKKKIDAFYSLLDISSLPKEQANALKKLPKALELLDKLEMERVSTVPDETKLGHVNIDRLLEKAVKSENRQKNEVKDQNKKNNELSKQKELVIKAYKNYLDRKKRDARATTEEEEALLADIENISRIEMVKDNGKTSLHIISANGKAAKIPFKLYKGKMIFSINDDSKMQGDANKLYKALESGSIEFTPETGIKNKKPKKLNKADFTSELAKLGIDKIEKTISSDEMQAVLIFLSVGKKKEAEQLSGYLKERAPEIEKQQKLKQLDVDIAAMQEHIAGIQKLANTCMKDAIEKMSDEEVLSLIAPAKGNNPEEQKKRSVFAFLLDNVADRKLKTGLYSSLVKGLQNDGSLWKDFADKYYKSVQSAAEDNFYEVLVEDLFSGKKSVSEALKETLLPNETAKLVLLRSIETYALAGADIKNAQKMDELHKKLGFRVSRKKFKVQKTTKVQSKVITEVMRCLADGHKLDLYSDKSKLKGESGKVITKREEIEEIFAQEPNYQPLIGDVLENKDEDAILIKAPTPYQKRFKMLGLLAALGADKNDRDLDNALFSQYSGVPIDAMIEQKKIKHKWNRDDYLFSVYAETCFDEQISLSAENIDILKEKYGWEDFKKINKDKAVAVFEDFSKKTSKADKLTAGLVEKGCWLSDLGNVSVHHIDPLKFAVSSDNPARYNDADNLAITACWNPWEDDKHKIEHLTTLEGVDCAAPYLITDKENYIRRPQVDLREGMEICYEKPQILNSRGQFEDIIPAKTLYASSSGLIITSPELPTIVKEHEKGPTKPHGKDGYE